MPTHCVCQTIPYFVSFTPNAWLYFSNSSISWTVMCGSKTDGCGVLYLDLKCTLSTAHATLSLYHGYSSTVHSLIPHINRIEIRNRSEVAIEFLSNTRTQMTSAKQQQFINALIGANYVGLSMIIIIILNVRNVQKITSNHTVCKV